MNHRGFGFLGFYRLRGLRAQGLESQGPWGSKQGVQGFGSLGLPGRAVEARV